MISCSVLASASVLAMRQVLSNFENYRQRVEDGDGHAWSWAEGVILFPEALCPMCNGVMRSTHIWHVDERSQRLVAVARLDSRRIQRVVRAVHPHVNGPAGGLVYLGNARSAAEALFLGLGMGSPYWNAGTGWYKDMFDHVCSPSSRRNSRDHLTQSIMLGEKKEAPAEPVVDITAAAVRAEAERREARTRVTITASRTRREPPAEQPLFNGSMVGNAESTGISADDQPTGLSLDRL